MWKMFKKMVTNWKLWFFGALTAVVVGSIGWTVKEFLKPVDDYNNPTA
jgi:hypothetical protein